MEYTRNEWKITSVGGVLSPHGHNITADNGEFIGRIRTEANARLIASAPDLYEACKTISAFYSDTGYRDVMPSMIEAVRKINQAIAKVESTPKPPDSHK